MRTFGTRGSVQPDRHYVVLRTEEVKDFINRVKDGRYIVLFAPRQTGKTTFFRLALATLAAEDPTYFPIQLSFDIYKNFSPPDFYDLLCKRIRKQIENVFQKSGHRLSETLTQLLDTATFSHHGSMLEFFEDFASLLAIEFGQILTAELDIPKTETITMLHFAQALTQLLRERNTNIDHLLTNIRKERQFENLLMRIISYERGIPFSLDNDIMSKLATYGVIKAGADGMCEIVNPIYLQCIIQTFQPFKYRQF